MDLNPNNWKHRPRTEKNHKFPLKNFYYDNKSTRKVKDVHNLSNK